MSITAFDHAVALLIIPLRTPLLTKIALYISFLGDEYIVMAISIILIVVLVIKKYPHRALKTTLIILGSEVFNLILKSLIKRARPSIIPLIPEPRLYSFPSGHAQASITFYLTLLSLIYSFTDNPHTRRWTALFCILMILLTGLSRIYLGVHWATDVLGGYLAGLVWLGIIYWLNRAKTTIT